MFQKPLEGFLQKIQSPTKKPAIFLLYNIVIFFLQINVFNLFMNNKCNCIHDRDTQDKYTKICHGFFQTGLFSDLRYEISCSDVHESTSSKRQNEEFNVFNHSCD
jgi:hypothetical protein